MSDTGPMVLWFCHITTVSGCDREIIAHFYSTASLKYHAPDTRHDTTPCHIILTLGRPVLALPRKSRPGIEPVTSRSPERTLYILSYRGRFNQDSRRNSSVEGGVAPAMTKVKATGQGHRYSLSVGAQV